MLLNMRHHYIDNRFAVYTLQQVRCIAQLIDKTGNPGIPLKSKPVTIGHQNPICKSPSFTSSIPYTYQAQSFLTKLRYVPPKATKHPNTIHVSVQVCIVNTIGNYFSRFNSRTRKV